MGMFYLVGHGLKIMKMMSNFPKTTQTWLEAWKNSPLTKDWTEIQWQFLEDTALLHASVWEDGNLSAMGELRRRCKMMGLTFNNRTTEQKKNNAA